MIESSAEIHPTAIVEDGAIVGARTLIDAFSLIRRGVKLGEDNHIGPHCIISGHTEMGSHNRLQSHCVLGAEPQDESWDGSTQRLLIGSHNTFYDYVSISGGASKGGVTTVGSGNMVMAYCHIGHDVRLGDRVRMANAATLAGHVQVEDDAWISGHCAVHQFVRIGAHAFLAGGSIVTQDVPRYCLVQGDRARLVALNETGLKRAGFTGLELSRLRSAFRILFRGQGLMADRCALVQDRLGEDPIVQSLLAFLSASARGCITTVRRAA